MAEIKDEYESGSDEKMPPKIGQDQQDLPEGFQDTPFHDRGGIVKAKQLFSDELEDLLEELNRSLAA